MPKSLGLLAFAGLVCLWPAAAAADGPYGRPLGQRPPSGVIHVAAGGENLIVWPYTTDDFTQPSDPINLIFPNADPRAIRQELMRLEGDRPPFSALSIHDCRWTDALGDEQAAFGLPERWVGGAVQLACAPEGAPLGIDFRVHMRLFRIGKDTIGGVHLDFLIPGTAEHETLSWDFPRSFVLYDMGRTLAVVAPVEPVGMIPAGTFRAVRRVIYDKLVLAGAGPFLVDILGLVAPDDKNADVPIPTDGDALGFVTNIDFAPARTHVVTTTQVMYNIPAPKPFCAAGPADYVLLTGPLQFVQSVSTDPSGLYERTYSFGGTLRVTPLGGGQAHDASIFELHRARLDDRRGEVSWDVQQSLLSDPLQSLRKHFAAGEFDKFVEKVVCGTE